MLRLSVGVAAFGKQLMNVRDSGSSFIEQPRFSAEGAFIAASSVPSLWDELGMHCCTECRWEMIFQRKMNKPRCMLKA